MFGGARRHRAQAAPLNSGTANPNATTAATSAFMSATNQNPNKALSSAAAAAALRARPHTPTNVAEVQTKRIMRRSASVSSTGSAARRPSNDPQLERRGSVSSMSERSFRSPSPHGARRIPEEAPPVPQIPTNHKNSAALPNTRRHGAQTQNFRTASQKLADEAHAYYMQPTGDTSNVRTSDAPMRSSSSKHIPPPLPIAAVPEYTRSDSRNSVNFSYPSTYRPQSPPATPTSPAAPYQAARPQAPTPSTAKTQRAQPQPSSREQASQEMVYDPNSRRMVPKQPVETAVEYRVRQAAEKPVKKKKDSGVRREGSHLARGTVGRPRGTTVDESQPHHHEPPPPPREQPVIEALPKAEEHPLLEEPAVKALITPGVLQQHESPPPSIIQQTQPQPRSATPETHEVASKEEVEPHISEDRPAATRVELPEESGSSESRESAQVPQNVLGALDAVETRQAVFEEPQISTSRSEVEPQKVPKHETLNIPADHSEHLDPAANEQKAHFAENRPVSDLVRTSGSISRSASNSPARQARFAPSPENLTIKHNPLPRSASPIKSALKRTETSPPDNNSEPSRSGAISPGQEESTVSRKKSVRVSWDDQSNVILGESAPPVETDSPIVPSPQTSKRPWSSILGRTKKKDHVLDDDEVMKPRPALPSFSSIREKKEPEEAPHARPHEPTPSAAQSSSTMVEEPQLGQSTDRAIGLLFTQDQASRIPANTSRFREPLPPVVTSVEGSGYHSDPLQSSDSEDEVDMSASLSTIPGTQTTQMTEPDDRDTSGSDYGTPEVTDQPQTKPTEYTSAPQEIPDIAIIQPTPLSSESTNQVTSSASHYFDLPGAFPSSASPSNQSLEDITQDESSSKPVFETPAAVQPNQAQSLPQTTLATTEPLQIPDDLSTEDSDEVFSDAYEDIPEEDEVGGFMSLDAIVDSPVEADTKPVPVNSSPIISETPSSAANGRAIPAIKDDDGWEQAKAYWRGLTAEKRRQLELEAAEDAGAEGDREEVSLPVRRNSSRRKSAEQKLLAQEASGGKPTSVSKKTQVQQTIPEHSNQPTDTDAKPVRMRRSLREEQVKTPEPQPQTGMRKTMRGAQHAGQRPTRQAAAPAITVPTTRSSAPQPRPQPAVVSPPESPLSRQIKPTLQRRGSDDSVSSFKRSSAAPSGGFFARRTMRQASPTQTQPEPTKGSGRFSIRSLSPAGSSIRRNSIVNSVTNSPQTGPFRRTLRSNSETSHEAKRSSMQFPSLGKKNKIGFKSSKPSSRLQDSSDEGDEPPRAAGFSSRFAESSDEEDARPGSSKVNRALSKGTLRASATAPEVRKPTMRTTLEEDSPDLPDSDDDQMPSPLQSPKSRFQTSDAAAGARLGLAGRTSSMGTSTVAASGNRSGRGALAPSLTDPNMSPRSKRGSFIGILRRNKRADQAGKIQRADLMESAARRDTKLERDAGALKDLRGEGQATSPRLQKRNPFEARNLTGELETNGNGTPQRPASAGHMFIGRSNTTNAIDRPTLSGRRSVSLGLDALEENDEMAAAENNVNTENPAGKKKKFGALRRMFKLDE
ncbi:hypothetical protein F5Y16DRAFT_326466 [Xylariaceae sp. FL0255]|nr:hypothetical protein F5Y16DRAFT_326466 [Xylariaceae sp. FL0255]